MVSIMVSAGNGSIMRGKNQDCDDLGTTATFDGRREALPQASHRHAATRAACALARHAGQRQSGFARSRVGRGFRGR